MNNLLYKIKNKIFRFSKEALKPIRPSFDELIKYKSFNRDIDSKFILSFGAGRCGQNWFSKIFNSHPNWIGSCERFTDFEAFYRFVNYYGLSVDKENFFSLLELALKRDIAKYKNTFIGSPYFSFGVEELSKRLHPNYMLFHLRDPIRSVESFYRKGWYLNSDHFIQNKIPELDISISLNRNFSRIVPNNDYFEEWIKLTRIGKITWFWATINKAVYDDFIKIKHIKKFIIKLEDADQNYNFYQRLSEEFKFENKMKKNDFYAVINKASNKGPTDKYKYKDWSNLEKKEFEIIISKIFSNYDSLKTNI